MIEEDESDESHESEAFEEEQTVDREEAAALLHDLADGVASGSVAFDDGALTVDVPATVELELEYEQDEDEHEVEVELAWDEESDEDAETDDPDEEAEKDPDDGEGDPGAQEDVDADHDGVETKEADADTGDETEETDADTGDDESDEQTAGSEDVDASRAERSGGPGDGTVVVATDGAGVEGVVGPGLEPRSRARFELYRDRAEEWRWRLRHHNGNIIADGGEGYNRKRSARNGLESVRRNAPGASVVEQD